MLFAAPGRMNEWCLGKEALLFEKRSKNFYAAAAD